MTKKFKVLIIGCGSIGSRHARNLFDIGVDRLYFYDLEIESAKKLSDKLGGTYFDSLDDALNKGPNIAFITNPTSLHINSALKTAKSGCHLFIEKPLSHTMEGVSELLEIIKGRGLITMVGCNMRFHPGPSMIKKFLDDELIGKVLFGQIYAGSYLPEWRPDQDYKKSYSALKDLGGGIILDGIHEIDLARWFTGPVSSVFCKTRNSGFLGIETEETASMIFTHKDGVVTELHLDYVQRPYNRGCRIVGEKGTLTWDFTDGAVRLYHPEEDSWETLPRSDDWELNRMYVDELNHFLTCVEEKRPTCQDIASATVVLEVALAAKRSALEGNNVSVDGFKA